MRAVFDTNVFISALAFPGGRGDQALGLIRQSSHRLVLSAAILAELAGVLVRKFRWNEDRALDACRLLADIADIVHPRARLSVLADEPDNRILEAAEAGRADVIVTGDKPLLALGRYKQTRILSLKEFLDG